MVSVISYVVVSYKRNVPFLSMKKKSGIPLLVLYILLLMHNQNTHECTLFANKFFRTKTIKKVCFRHLFRKDCVELAKQNFFFLLHFFETVINVMHSPYTKNVASNIPSFTSFWS